MFLRGKVSLVVALVVSYLNAEIFEDIKNQHFTSFQGFTGVINTPNAQVLDYGELSFSWNNQFDEHLRGYNHNLPYTSSDDYVFGVGILPSLEMQGRLKEQPKYARDLSANFKFKLPKIIDWFPDIAIGAQDVGSAANKYENYYLVADKSVGPLRASVGYGYSNSSAKGKRMDGVFGAVELQTFSWLSLLAEYDGKQKHIGARVWKNLYNDSLKITSTLAYNLSAKKTNLMISASIYPSLFQEQNRITISNNKPIKTYQELISKLEQDGFKDISLYKKDNSLVLEYENSNYRVNDLDAIIKITNYILSLDRKKEESLILISKKSGVEVDTILLSLSNLNKFLKDRSFENKSLLQNSIKNIKLKDKGKLLASGLKSEKLRTHIKFEPILKTMVGTDVGVLDYQFLLATSARVHLLKGLDFTTQYDFHIDHSDDFEVDTFGAYRYLYNKGGLNSLMLNYSTNYKNFINTLSVGLYKYDYYGVADQLTYINGNHTFGFKLGYFKYDGNYDHPDYQDEKKLFLAKYTYSYRPLDLQLSIQGGKYWKQDTGFDVELKKFFGEVAVSLKYTQTKPDTYLFDWSESTNKYVGLYLEIPLDFRKSKTSWDKVQLEGARSFKHGIRTTFKRADGSNRITPGYGEEPIFNIDHYNFFTNRNRSGAEYVKNSLDLF